MKKWGILLLAGLVGAFVLTGCQPDLSKYVTTDMLKTQLATVSGQTAACMSCHDASTVTGGAILGAEGQYDLSGHLNGYRELINEAGTYVFENAGSNSNYANGSSCARCHSAEGFINYAGGLTGTAALDMLNTSPIGCQTCHAPHTDLSIPTYRKTSAVTLVDGTTSFNQGNGNLCVNCHQARTLGSSKISSDITSLPGTFSLPTIVTFATAVSAGTNTDTTSKGTKPNVGFTTGAAAPTANLVQGPAGDPHHGPNSDMLMGVNGFLDSSITTPAGEATHLSATTDGCIDCHMFYEPSTGRTSGSLAMGGHGMYLTATVHGATKDYTDVCTQCHNATTTTGAATWPLPTTLVTTLNNNVSTQVPMGTTFDSSGHNGAGYDGGATRDILQEIEGLEQKLIAYFSSSANFLEVSFAYNSTANTYTGYTINAAQSGHAPINAESYAGSAAAGTDWTPNAHAKWLADWNFFSFTDNAKLKAATQVSWPYLYQNQAKALWNLQFYEQDKSHGIHNPKYAAQLLYSACKLVGISVGSTAP